MNVYFISGLGADRRIFKKLVLPVHWNIHHIEWIPNKPNEPLADYCHRLAAQIDSSKPFVLVGLSFGGIVAIELSKFLNPEKIILLSTVCNRSELPLTIRLMKYLPLYKLVPHAMLQRTNPVVHWVMGVITPEEINLVKEIAADSAPSFLLWAVGQIAQWNNTAKPANATHIHGASDRIFPKHYNKADICVPGGGHLMTYSKADIISTALIKAISDNPTG